MGNINFIYIVYVYTIVMVTYYVVGGEAFPDYSSYLELSHTGLEGTYFTEFLSQYILSSPNFNYDGFNNVDSLALFVQVVIGIISIIYIINNKESVYSFAIFFSLYLPLIITTTLRASLVYFLFFIFSLSRARFKLGVSDVLIFTFLGCFFHDSTLLISFFLIVFIFLQKSKLIYRLSPYKYIIASLMILIFGPLLKSFILSNVDLSFLGERAVYLKFDSFSNVKFIFLLCINILVLICIRERESNDLHSIYLACFLLCCLSFVFFLSSTAGIRFSIFTMSYLVATRGVLFFKFEKKIKNRVFMIFPLFLIFLFQIKILL